MPFVLVNYNFRHGAKVEFERLASTDGRNLWVALLVDRLRRETDLEPVFPDDLDQVDRRDVAVEVHINARRPLCPDAEQIGLFMETRAVWPDNSVSAARAYRNVLSFDPELAAAGNLVRSELPCWSPTTPRPAANARSGYAMIAANKGFPEGVDVLDFYRERRNVIRYFERSGRGDFALYGRGWDKSLASWDYPRLARLGKRLGLIGALSCWKGEADSKYATLGKHVFNVCYENCDYPGYISEKFFDAVIAGCVPIYRSTGASRSVLPAGAFIDAADFKSVRALIAHCDSLGSTDLEAIREAGAAFLDQGAGAFTHEAYAASVFDLVVSAVPG